MSLLRGFETCQCVPWSSGSDWNKYHLTISHQRQHATQTCFPICLFFSVSESMSSSSSSTLLCNSVFSFSVVMYFVSSWEINNNIYNWACTLTSNKLDFSFHLNEWKFKIARVTQGKGCLGFPRPYKWPTSFLDLLKSSSWFCRSATSSSSFFLLFWADWAVNSASSN